jgi:single-strand DNA-binding protein
MSANITLVGRVGSDPEDRAAGNTTMATFSVATTTREKDSTGDWKEKTTWWRVKLFGQQADFATKYVHKGDLVEVPGEASQSEYTAKDGTVKQSLEVKGHSVKNLTPAKDGATAGSGGQRRTAATEDARPARRSVPPRPADAVLDDQDLPF